MQELDILIRKTMFYISQVGQFGFLNQPLQVIMSVCPSILKYLDWKGLGLLLVLFITSFFHTRLFHIFLILVIMRAKLPDETDKKFWRNTVLFSSIVFLWAMLHFTNETAWVAL